MNKEKHFWEILNGYSSLGEFLPALHYNSDHLFENNRYKEKTKLLKEL